jgi:hypothetical protein
VIKARTWFSLLMISLGTVAATASCGSDEATGGSGAGGGALIGEGGANDSSGRGGGAVGRAGSGSGGGSVAASSGLLGSTCSVDADCGDGLTCLTPDSTALGSGGPSNGLCTLACTTNGECAAVETGAACVGFANNSYCLESCEQGEPVDINTKCQGRPDFVCQDLADYTANPTALPAPFCVPLCRSDIECGTGYYCSPASGLCSKTKPKGDPVGTACNPNATTDTCEGSCITTSAKGVTPVTGNCVEVCSGELPCMYNGTKPGGFCIGALSDNFGSLDLGVCEPNCACPSDCALPGDLCRAWSSNSTEQQLKTALGADGLCYPNALDSVALDCGEGGASSVPGAAGAGG